jgi:aminoglycoside phosphotransferase (APT) family kinase protein
MRLRLHVLRGLPEVQTFGFSPGSTVTLGRGSESHIQLMEAGVSRDHCKVEFFAPPVSPSDGPGVPPPRATARLVDLGSRNGTTVNREKVLGSVALAHGDVIRLGRAKLRVEYQAHERGDPTEETSPLGLLEHPVACTGCGLPLEEVTGALALAARLGEHYLCRDCHGSLEVRDSIGPWRLLSRIGSGAFATVYKAADQARGEVVALKVIELAQVPDERLIRMFEREIGVLHSLHHPNIVRLITAETLDTRIVLAMELIDGCDLHKLIQREGALPVDRAVAIAVAALDGLAFAHERGVIHRDIKPANLLIDPAGRVRVADFGLAKSLDASQLGTLTKTGEALGTPRYMPPEQLQDARSVDHRADVYAFGATLWHALSGQEPFPEARSLGAVARAVMRTTPKRLDELRDDVPAPLAKAVARALSKDPSKRQQTVAGLRLALASVVG